MRTKVILLFLFVFWTSSWSMPIDSTEITCPICAAKFKDLSALSRIRTERSMGWYRYGDLGEPYPLPICPSCHFPYYTDKVSKRTRDTILNILQSQEYKACYPGNTSYYLLGTLLKAMNAKPLDIGYAFLGASRQVKDNHDKFIDYLALSSEYLNKYMHSPDTICKEHLSIYVLYGELLRRQCKKIAADSFFTILSQEKRFIDLPPYPEIINYELKLIKNNDCSPSFIPMEDFAAQKRESDSVIAMVKSLPGYDTITPRFVITDYAKGLINEAPYSLHVDLKSVLSQRLRDKFV